MLGFPVTVFQRSVLRETHIKARMKDLQWIMTSSSRLSSKDPKLDVKAENVPSQTMNTKRTYKEAIEKLNDLQSNASVLQNARKHQGKLSHRNIPEATLFAKRGGITVDLINKLSIIHVSGTKGKGSVCAFCESILRKHGLKTGFYSSPHLVEVRERIRINGMPLEKEEFTDYFFDVYDKLEATKPNYDNAMPAYFRFLTIMALHVFLQEKVDVALVEVGIGGEYDCTNIIREPTVVGITSLGYDHTFLLGDTLDKIAWHKAGICKKGKPVFTVPQPEDAMRVVLERSKEIGAPAHCAPPLERNNFGEHSIQLGLAGEHQHSNASLAIQLCKSFLEKTKNEQFQVFTDPESGPSELKKARLNENFQSDVDIAVAEAVGMPVAEPILLPESFIAGLRDCYWAGRNQTIVRERVTYYIDGAHTLRSIEACRKWFMEETEKEEDCKFDGVVFCPNVVSEFSAHKTPDLTYKHTSNKPPLAKAQALKSEFEGMLSSLNMGMVNGVVVSNGVGIPCYNGTEPNHIHSHTFNNNVLKGDHLNEKSSFTASPPVLPVPIPVKCVAVPSITDALQWAACAKDPHLSSPRREDPSPPDAAIAAERIQVLVAGSIHLVGGVIKVLDPELALHQ
ncbi:Folylpolyglutamate synthase, mitochondrial [Holothuria leucospilota]|uniref:tetrahydrofolate synthase n=1 Tax=Holothuria leucospilota TaxID=206669 RepID=A0A9Q1HB49_HOLLE|nr:Folylpolyglutamate synthase, mitochondrial [Holothuria leucospilota]